MACPQRGRKRESSCESGESRAAALRGERVSQSLAGEIFFGIKAAGARWADQCYEPAEAKFVFAIQGRRRDAEAVITTS
jgi:hypothetical protein